MAQLLLASAGAALGGTAISGGILTAAGTLTFGAQLGWIGGNLLGGLLGQKGVHTVQPGLADKSVQASTYGSYQTRVYGTMRVAGNVVDGVSEIREVLHTTRTGKGAPKSSNTTRTWNVDIAIDLAQAGCAGIRKIWQAGKLVYDVSSGASAASIIASSIRATSFKLYDGAETQLPDPTLEAIHGAGNVPAYRGRSMCVIAGLDCPNGQIPQLQFELSMAITAAATLPALTPALPFEPELTYQSYVYSQIGRLCGPDVVYHMVLNESVSDTWSAQGFRAGNGYTQKLWTTVLPNLGTGNYGFFTGMNGGHTRPLVVRNALGLNAVYSTTNTTTIIDMLTGEETVVRTFVPGSEAYDLNTNAAAYDEITGKFILVGSNAGARTYERFNPQIYDDDVPTALRLALPSTAGSPLAFYNDIVYTFDQRAGVTYVQLWNASTGAFISEVGGGPATLNCTSSAPGSDPASGVVFNGWMSAISAHAGGVFVYCKTNNKVWRIDSSWREISSTIANSTTTTVGIQNPYIEQDYIVEGPLVAAPDATAVYRVAATKSFDPLDVTTASIITDVCALAGLSAGQIDVSACTDTLRGYAITHSSSARAAIEPLLKGWFYDVVQEDGKVKFLPRAAQVSRFSVAFDELAAAVDAGTTSADPLPLARTDVTELPRSYTVTYLDQDADYQSGSQSAVRQTVTNANDQAIDLPLATTANRAATVAHVHMFDAWSNANARSASLAQKYAYVSPGDIGEIEYPRGTTKTYRVTRASNDGAVCKWDVVDADTALPSHSVVGAAQHAEQAGPSLVPPVAMAVLDIPMLRDADNDNGLYVAVDPYTATGYVGAVLYKGNDDSSLVDVASVTTSASIGIATTLLANWADNTPDWVNTVRVEEVGTLASSTLDGCLNNGDNLCLIGDELLQFVTATYISSGKYTLSGLIRGRKGTERYKSTHTAFERFVLLPATGAGIMRVLLDIGELNQSRQYRAISLGLSADSAASQSFTSEGISLKPLQVVDFKRSALNGNNYLSWNRRSRFTGEFPDSTDIPLGENAEQYVVDVYADSTFALVVRSISAVTPSLIYTLAQQVVDFGGYQLNLYLRIYQLSALVGRGIPLQVSSTLANINSTPPSLLAHMDGAGVITTPVDSSSYAFAGALTGSAALSSTQSKFGSSSLYSPGTGVCGCNFDTSSAAFSFGTGDFTVEFWAYAVAATNNANLFAISETGALGSVAQACLYLSLNQTTGALFAQTYAGAAIDANVTSAASAFPIGAWNHVAITRRAGTLYMFINGISRGTPAASAGTLNYTAGMKTMVGGWQTTSSATMYFDEVRITKGEAVYFADFTPPTAPF